MLYLRKQKKRAKRAVYSWRTFGKILVRGSFTSRRFFSLVFKRAKMIAEMPAEINAASVNQTNVACFNHNGLELSRQYFYF